MRQWKSAFAMLHSAWRPLFEFELLYKLLALAVFTPLASLAFRGILRAAGYAYLTVDNLGPFLRQPLTVLLLAVLALGLAFYVVFDIAAILYALDLGRVGRQADVPGMCAAAGRAAARVLWPRNWPLALAALCLLPFLHVGIVSGFVCTAAVPEAVTGFLLRHRALLAGAVAAAAGLGVLILRWLYLFHCYALEGCPFTAARRRSVALGRGRRLRDLGVLLGLQAVFALVFLAAAALLVAAIVFLTRLLAERQLLYAALSSAVWMALAALFLIFSLLAAPISFCCISVLYYRRQGAGVPPPPDAPRRTLNRRAFRRLEAALLLVLTVCCARYVYRIARGEANPNIEYVRTAEVTAHRGASAQYPENTMAAFRAAAEQGANWIELDVQETRDGVLVVLHDATLRRTAGDHRAVGELTAAEIAKLEAGSWFSEEFRGEPIPRLEEVLAFAREAGVRLNIELKPTARDRVLEAETARLIRAWEMEERCVVTSQSYAALERLKACGPELKTAYVMGLAYGDLLHLDAADAFSIHAASITPGLVSRLHDGQKEVYAWTVNSRGSIDKLLRMQVDNVITDDVPLARARVYAGKTSSLIQEYIAFLAGF